MNDIDNRLLKLLQHNSRCSITDLASKLGVSRITVKQHMSRLEKSIIERYSIELKELVLTQQVRAIVFIAVEQRWSQALAAKLRTITSVKSLDSISGEYDYVAHLCADNTTELDHDMDAISQIDGILRTMTSVILSNKFRR